MEFPLSGDNKRKQYPPFQLRDSEGRVTTININNGLSSEIDGTGGYSPSFDKHPNGFFIKPLVSGTIKVRLIGQAKGDSYTFSTEEVNAYIGKRLEERVVEIIATGTTVDRLKVVW